MTMRKMKILYQSQLKSKLQLKANAINEKRKAQFLEILSDDEEESGQNNKVRWNDASVPQNSTFKDSENKLEDQSVTTFMLEKDFQSSSCKIIGSDG